MNKYQDSKIYKLIDDMNDLIYIGSTTRELKKRLWNHISKYNQYVKGNDKYVTSFEIIKRGNYRIELIEHYPCESQRELSLREGYYIKSNNCVNKRIEGRTKKEYKQNNYDKLHEKFNCDKCGGSYTRKHMWDHNQTKKHIESLNIN